MDLDELWRLLRCDDAVATGSGDDLVVGRVATIDEGNACVSGCNGRGEHASRWCGPDDVRLADDAEAEMYRAWQGIELYRDVFPHARAWMDAHTFPSDAPEAADAPDDGLAHDDWEVPPSPDAVAHVREALRRADHALAGLRNALIVERELQARCAELERERDEARAELERVKAALDDLMAPICTPSVPEPPPRAGGALVTPMVLAWIASQRVNVGQERVDQALRLVLERDAFGRGKYGQGLALEDGRDTVEDLRQELGDAIQYGYKARVEGVEGERLEEVRWLAHLLRLLLCADKVEVGP